MPGFVNLPWLNQPNPVETYERGLQLGMQAGTEQARQQLQQEQMVKQEQQQAIENARQAAQFHMQSEQQARKFAAQQRFQSLVQQGTDPARALLQVAPDLGESLTGAAQLYKATLPPSMSPYQQEEVKLRKRALDLQQDKQDQAEEDPFQSGPVQGQPVLDPDSKQPIPGLIATPSASGKGMTVRLTPKAEASLTPSTAKQYFEAAPDIDRIMGVNPKSSGSFTRRMATNMVDVAKSTLDKTEIPVKTKVEKANALARVHPDWTKKQIIDAVNAGKDE